MGTAVPMLAAGLYAPLAKIFLDRGYEVNIHSLPNFGLGRLDEASDILAETVFGGDPNRRAILVGHSQGGVHAVDHAHRYPDQVWAVFTFGSPAHGTRMANLGRFTDRIPAIGHMAAHSEYLRDMRDGAVYPAHQIHSMYTLFDQLVIPWFSPAVRGGNNILLAPKWLHCSLGRLGQRRSQGVERMVGFAEHVFIIQHKGLHDYIETVLDELEKPIEKVA